MTIPLSWIDIPAGNVILREWVQIQVSEVATSAALTSYSPFEVTAFAISKYPITNAQFAPFIETGEYQAMQYWTAEGWQRKEQEHWLEPRFWQVAAWNGLDYPVVGVSWYEALAFCQWLGARTGESVSLPTEPQWHRAAQGDDGRDCPWNDWNDDYKDYLNTSIVEPWGNHRTSPVDRYEGKGDSPFKVVDMLGNVQEWTLSQYQPEHLRGQNNWRITCGSWNPYWYGHLNSRSGLPQHSRSSDTGFRICRAGV